MWKDRYKMILLKIRGILTGVFFLWVIWHLFKLFGKKSALLHGEGQDDSGCRRRKVVESKVVEKQIQNQTVIDDKV